LSSLIGFGGVLIWGWLSRWAGGKPAYFVSRHERSGWRSFKHCFWTTGSTTARSAARGECPANV